MKIEQLFLEASIDKLTQLAGRIEVCFSKLSEEQIWARGQQNENALGNLALHLDGNVRQWILAGLAGSVDARRRDAEFSAKSGATGPELAAKLQTTVALANTVIAGLSEEALGKTYTIQGYSISGIKAVLHVVEHFSYHTGQIIFATKHVTGEDLGFYRHLSSGGSQPGGSEPAAPPAPTKP